MEDDKLTLNVDRDLAREGFRNLDELRSSFMESDRDVEAYRKEEQATEEQETKIEEDPRNQENWGIGAVAEEVKSAVTGGLQDTASSITTFGERTVDALSGEMQREKEELGYYRPDWDPFVDHKNPIITKTWWGQLLRGTVHFGTMAAGVIYGGGALAAKTGISAAGTIAANSLVRAAGIGAVSDLISKESDGHNALGMLRDRYGFMDTPISTRDTDHPIWMKFKNIVEGMGIGLVFDSASILLGKGSKKVINQVANRNKSVELQTLRKGIQELRANESRLRGSKNKGVAEPHQGAHISQDDPYVVWERQKRINNEWGAEDGSAGNVTTPIQRERVAREAGITEEVVEDVLRRLYSNEKFKATIDLVKGNRQRLVEVFGDSIAAHQRITLGREAADMSAKDYLSELYKARDRYDITDFNGEVVDTIETFTSKNVAAADLVVGTLIQQLRDLGIAGREIGNFANLADIDGPADQIYDTLMTALTEIKKARIVKSDNFRELGAGKRRYLEETLTKEMADTRESIQSILKIAGEEQGDLLMALFEAFSSMKTVNSLDDFDAWARKMIKGGEIEGKFQTGAVIRELQGVMIHSILSGPKTSARALIGTSTATILRPISTALGAAMRGDSVTARSSLSSMMAMIEAIPEAWTLFKTRLDGYWSGDIATVKSRFAEFTKGDENWEILRRWAEDSGRANDGDRAAFYLANTARAMNDNSFLTYSTKLMAATDDTFTYILGRAKMREKAFRSAMDAQANRKLTAYPDLDPALIKMYEEDFYREVFDASGNITDKATEFARKEVTLTKELNGFARGLNQVFQANPWVKPFFLFARTGVNGLELTAKHTPGFNFLVKEWNDIAFAKPQNLESVAKYGITTAEELANAQALQTGRLAIGTGIMSMIIMSGLSGNITGNGPVDRQKRKAWIDAGYRPRQIKIGGVWVGYEAFEPFSQMIAMTQDTIDFSQLMGQEWTEKTLLKGALVIAEGITSKSYLAGVSQLVDIVGGNPHQAPKILGSLANNTVPFGALRNDIGKAWSPYMRELSSDVGDAIRNRNLASEGLSADPLPIKYSMMDGEPLRDWDFLTRIWQTAIPVTFNLDYNEAQQILFAGGFDKTLSTFYSPTGINLTNSPRIRSMFQREIGKLRMDKDLKKLAKNPRIIASIRQQQKDIRDGRRGDYETIDYYHTKVFQAIMRKKRNQAWANLADNHLVKTLEREQRGKKRLRYDRTQQTLLAMYK